MKKSQKGERCVAIKSVQQTVNYRKQQQQPHIERELLRIALS